MGYTTRFREQHLNTELSGQATVELPDYATGTVHHDAVLDDGTILHHHQRFEAGRLVEWAEDQAPGPWALVRPGEPFQPYPKVVASPEDSESVLVRIGDEQLVLPPIDDFTTPDFDALEDIPDATAFLRFELMHTPVGTQYCDVRYQDGKRWGELVGEWPQRQEGEWADDAPELHIAMSWRNYLRMRAGELTALEAIEDGGMVDARWTLLLLLHGMIQSPAYVHAYRSLPRIPEELGWWGEVAPHVPEVGSGSPVSDSPDSDSPDSGVPESDSAESESSAPNP